MKTNNFSLNQSKRFPQYPEDLIDLYFSRPDLMYEIPIYEYRSPQRLLLWLQEHGYTEITRNIDIGETHRLVDREPNKGLDLIGPLLDYSGVGESSRIIEASLSKHNYLGEIASLSLSKTRSKRNKYSPVKLGSNDCLVIFNGNLMRAVSHRLTKGWNKNIKVFGFWAWELEKLHDSWLDGLNFVDEIITPSSFCANTIKAYTNKPVHVLNLPSLYEFRSHERFKNRRDDFNLREEYFIVIFDFLSCSERKNIIGTIKYFLKAFPRTQKGPKLVIKAINDSNEPVVKNVKKIVSDNKNLIYINKFLSDKEIYSLIQNSLGLISLHRSEGYGLGLLNAMYMGKLVIATKYSGNLDFMSEQNSILIPYTSIEPSLNSKPIYYETKTQWADPDLDYFVDAIRKAYFSESYRKSLEAAAEIHIKNNFNSNTLYTKLNNIL